MEMRHSGKMYFDLNGNINFFKHLGIYEILDIDIRTNALFDLIVANDKTTHLFLELFDWN